MKSFFELRSKTFTWMASLLSGVVIWGQSYPKDYFSSPLDIPLYLSGNFGELRGTHFHTGLDFKTQGKEGLEVRAAAAGYVSRVKVSLWGYGKAVYIKHPNGYETVYAHLQRFAPNIERRVKAYQYTQQTYEVELYFKESEIPVKKQECIALSGNTGGSAGPHLHFEIRDASSSNTINPLHFGYEISDHIAPLVSSLYVYPLSDSSQVNGSRFPTKVNFTRRPDGVYQADAVQALGDIAWGIEAIDRQDKSWNKNGIYGVDLSVNGTSYLRYIFDELSFSESRYLLTLMDYPHWADTQTKIQRLYVTPSNKISTIYKKNFHRGILSVEEGMSYTVEVKVFDFEGNETKIQIPVKGKNNPVKDFPSRQEGKPLLAHRDYYFNFEGGKVYFPKETFFDDFVFQLEKCGDTIKIHRENQPLKGYYQLTMNALNQDVSRTYIAYIDSKNRPQYQETTYDPKEKTFSAKVRNLGRFMLKKDTILPEISPMEFSQGAHLTGQKLQLKITDKDSGIRRYTARLNGKWILMEYEPKTDLLSFDFSDFDSYPYENELYIEVEDKAGNINTQHFEFYR